MWIVHGSPVESVAVHGTPSKNGSGGSWIAPRAGGYSWIALRKTVAIHGSPLGLVVVVHGSPSKKNGGGSWITLSSVLVHSLPATLTVHEILNFSIDHLTYRSVHRRTLIPFIALSISTVSLCFITNEHRADACCVHSLSVGMGMTSLHRECARQRMRLC